MHARMELITVIGVAVSIIKSARLRAKRSMLKNVKSMSRFLQDINFRTDQYFVSLFKDLILSKYNNIHICDQNMTNMRMTRSF